MCFLLRSDQIILYLEKVYFLTFPSFILCKKLSSCPVLNKYNNFLDLVFHFSTKTHSLSSGGGLLSPNACRKISCPRCFRQLCRVDRSSLGRRRSYFRSHHSTRKVLIRDSNLNPLPSLLFSKRGR